MFSENNRICKLFGIKYPIIAGGMAWCSGWRLASAVSNCGGLGLIGAGSMSIDIFKHHLSCCKNATSMPFGVNIPLMHPQIEDIMKIIVSEDVKIVFTSAGNPATWTSYLHDHGIKVCHVISSSNFAKKSEKAGVDAIVAEGFEAGGHNGREETTSLCLIPAVREATSLPLIAAGGIAIRSQINAVHMLGAEGVQIGTRFALCSESSASDNFKDYCRGLEEGGTKLLLKKLSPTRLVRGAFMDTITIMESQGATKEELLGFIGIGAAKRGMLEGDTNAEMELGQVATLVKNTETVKDIFDELTFRKSI